MTGTEVRYDRRRPLIAADLEALFEVAWGVPKPNYKEVLEHSFTWVTAHSGSELIGFVNIASDGGVHFFLLDTAVHPDWQHRGVGRRLVEEAITACTGRGEWLHVDAPEELMDSLYIPCGFKPTPAGVINLRK